MSRLGWNRRALLAVIATLAAISSSPIPDAAGSTPVGTITTAAGGPMAGRALNIGIVPNSVAFHGGAMYFSTTSVPSVRRLDLTTGIATIVAGNGTWGDMVPRDLAFDPAGNLFVIDSGRSALRQISSSGVVSTVMPLWDTVCGPPGDPLIRFSPSGLAFDSAGNLFFGNGDRVCKRAPDGTLSLVAGGGAVIGSASDGQPATQAALEFVTGVAVAADGTVYVSECCLSHLQGIYDHGDVRRVGPDGTISTFMATPKSPAGLLIDSAGRLTVAESYGGRVIRREQNGDVTVLLDSGPDSHPVGLATNPASGDLVIADFGLKRIRSLSPTGALRTLAGNGNSAFSGDGGPAATTQLNQPKAVAADRTGAVYVADMYDNRVRRIGPDGRVSTVAGNGGGGSTGDGGLATSAQLASPQSVAVDNAGNVYIGEQQSGKVRKVGLDGRITTVAGGGPNLGDGGPATSAYFHPSGLTVGPLGTLFIADTYGNRVREVLPGGTIRSVAGTGTAGSAGDGGLALLAQLNRPEDIAFDQLGNLYIADMSNQRVRKVSPLGIITTFLDANGTATQPFPRAWSTFMPCGLTVDNHGRVLVAELQNHRIFAVDRFGTPSVVVGESFSQFAGDGGPGQAAGIDHACGVTTTADGTTWIADSANARVRAVTGTPAPAPPKVLGITTQVGNGAVTVSWNASTVPVVGYSVIATSGSARAVWQNVAGDTTSVSVAGLVNGRSYEFVLVARTSSGASSVSAPVTATPSNQAASAVFAGAPRNVSVVAGRSGLTANWLPPATDGGAPIVAYSVVARDTRNGAYAWRAVGADDRSASVGGLADGVLYEVSVFAWTARGAGGAAGPIAKAPSAGAFRPPAAPSFAVSAPTGANTTVWWGSPADEGDRPVVAYSVVALRRGQVVSWTNAPASARSAVVPTPPSDATLVIWATTGASNGAALQVAPAQ